MRRRHKTPSLVTMASCHRPASSNHHNDNIVTFFYLMIAIYLCMQCNHQTTTIEAQTTSPSNSFARRFSPFTPTLSATSASTPTTSSESSGGSATPSTGNPLVWAPLRATFRPLNRPQPPTPPRPPQPPQPPVEPAPPVALARIATTNDFESSFTPPTSSSIDPRSIRLSASSFQPTLAASTLTSSIAPAPTSPPALFARGGDSTGETGIIISSSSSTGDEVDDEDQPTRAPMNRFRPTPAPSVEQTSTSTTTTTTTTAQPNLASSSDPQSSNNNSSNPYRLSKECFECICEASTSCNEQSRCQTSDVRHTRCGMFLISYDQWLASGLSRELVTPEALAQDVAADERAFYQCVTDRLCAERVLKAYMQKASKDCDKDGRLDCYDAAAIHHSGTDECGSDSLLNSQYWSDFSACFGFGR